MTNDEVHDELNRWLTQTLGVQAIKDRQGIDRPALPYVMSSLASLGQVQAHVRDVLYRNLPPPDGEARSPVEATPLLELEWVFLVFAYGDGCDSILRRLKSARHLAQVQEPLMPKLTIHEVGNVNLIPEFLGNRWEPRAQANVVLRGIADDGFVIDVIEEYEPFDIERKD